MKLPISAVLVSALTATATLALPAPAMAIEYVDDGAGDANVTLLNSQTPPIRPGQSAWIHLTWTSDAEARDFRVTGVQANGQELGYPENTDDHSSLYWNDVLSNNEIDYTALKVTLPDDAVAPSSLSITLSFESDSGTQTQTFDVDVQVDDSEYDGDGVALDAGSLGSITAGQSAWLDVGMTGLDDVSDVEVRVTDPAGFGIVFPGDAAFGQLSQSADLALDQHDVTAIQFDATGLDAGDYDVEIEITSHVGTTEIITTETRTVTVTEDDGTPTGPATGDVLYDSAAAAGDWTFNPYGTDTATTGMWDISVPDFVSWSGWTTQLGYTPSGQPGVITTGAAGASTGVNDVDSGQTTALSPEVAIGANGASISFAYYLAYLDNSGPDDFLKVTVIGENGQSVIVEVHGEAEHINAEWVTASADLSDFAGQTIQILVEAADNGTPSLVEAAVADILVVSL